MEIIHIFCTVVLVVFRDWGATGAQAQPVITRIHPQKTTIGGAFEQTVIGKALDTVPAVYMRVVLIENIHGVEDIVRPENVKCAVSGATKMICKVPKINSFQSGTSISNYNQRHDEYHIHYPFQMRFSSSPQFTDTLRVENNEFDDVTKLLVYEDPKFQLQDDMVRNGIRKYKGEDTLTIEAAEPYMYLDKCCQTNDFKVFIGGKQCHVITSYTNAIRCRLPEDKPSGRVHVYVDVGEEQQDLGEVSLYYKWIDVPAHVLGLAIGIPGAIFSVFLVVVLLRCVRTQYRKYEHYMTHIHITSEPATNEDSSKSLLRVFRLLPPDKVLEKIDSNLAERVRRQFKHVEFIRVNRDEEIGRGHFGKVFPGTHTEFREGDHPNETKLAIKMLKDGDNKKEEVEKFLEEGLIMAEFRHRNVMDLFGVSLMENNPMILLRKMSSNRAILDDPNKILRVGDLVYFVYQAASGMNYLTGGSSTYNPNPILHRDLAVRNLLWDEHDEHLTLKISDFGLAVFGTEVVEDSINHRPYKSLALETLQGDSSGKHVYTTRTEVWSFGVMAWELLTRGKKPYSSLSHPSRIIKHLTAGNRLPHPDSCPVEIYSLIKKCWDERPRQRPPFATLEKEMLAHLRNANINLDSMMNISSPSSPSSPTSPTSPLEPSSPPLPSSNAAYPLSNWEEWNAGYAIEVPHLSATTPSARDQRRQGVYNRPNPYMDICENTTEGYDQIPDDCSDEDNDVEAPANAGYSSLDETMVGYTQVDEIDQPQSEQPIDRGYIDRHNERVFMSPHGTHIHSPTADSHGAGLGLSAASRMNISGTGGARSKVPTNVAVRNSVLPGGISERNRDSSILAASAQGYHNPSYDSTMRNLPPQSNQTPDSAEQLKQGYSNQAFDSEDGYLKPQPNVNQGNLPPQNCGRPFSMAVPEPDNPTHFMNASYNKTVHHGSPCVAHKGGMASGGNHPRAPATKIGSIANHPTAPPRTNRPSMNPPKPKPRKEVRSKVKESKPTTQSPEQHAAQYDDNGYLQPQPTVQDDGYLTTDVQKVDNQEIQDQKSATLFTVPDDGYLTTGAQFKPNEPGRDQQLERQKNLPLPDDGYLTTDVGTPYYGPLVHHQETCGNHQQQRGSQPRNINAGGRGRNEGDLQIESVYYDDIADPSSEA